MINIVVPMAGAGSRFKEAGYADPKPMIDVNGEPMISLVVKNLKPKSDHKFIFICQKEHFEKYDISGVLKKATNDKCEFVIIDGITEGAACTVLAASEHINNDDELIIANSDQYLEQSEMDKWIDRKIDDAAGLIMTFKANHPKWSYARVDENNIVKEVAEKRVISEWATNGIYWFRHGFEFVDAATSMIAKDIRHNNEFYVCPVFNEMILSGKKIKHFPTEKDKFHGLGTPHDLEKFLSLNIKT